MTATRPAGSSEFPTSPASHSARGQVGHRSDDGDADLDVGPLGAELVVTAIRRPSGRAAEVGEPVRHIRQVQVEQCPEIKVFERMLDTHRDRRRGGQLDDARIAGCLV